MKDQRATKHPPETQKPPSDPTTELYKRAIEQADSKKPGAVKKKPIPDGEAIGELGDELGGPA